MTDIHDQLAETLRDLRGRFGEAVFNDRRRLTAHLLDAAPDARREIRVIATALDEGVPAALLGADRPMLGLEMDRQANRLESATGLRIDLALQVVRVLAFALELGPPPSVYAAATPAPVIATPSAAFHAVPAPQTSSTAWNAPPPSPAARGSFDRFLAGIPLIGRFHALPTGTRYAITGALAAVALGAYFVLPNLTPGGVPAEVAAGGTAYAGELTDYGIAAQSTLESNVGSPTPLEVPVGRRVTTGDVQALIARDQRTLLIDVLADQHSSTLSGALYMPMAGYPGDVRDSVQTQVAAQLRTVTEGDLSRPLVFFCMGPVCWESYNAALRAAAAGYRTIYWYRGGLAAWQAANLPMQPLGRPVGQDAAPGAATNLFR